MKKLIIIIAIATIGQASAQTYQDYLDLEDRVITIERKLKKLQQAEEPREKRALSPSEELAEGTKKANPLLMGVKPY